jgi:AmmeMemoRadiSam system protein B
MFGFGAQKTSRAPVAAGRFYPREPEELRAVLGQLLAGAPRSEGPAPKALIVPHAGYLYSGTTAAAAYASLLPERHLIRRVILLGPSHFVLVEGLAVSRAEEFRTPLGAVPIDAELIGRLKRLPQVRERDEAHAQEHSLEVQLPFLQVVLDDFTLVPLTAGQIPAEQLAEVLEVVWGGAETRVVISSDLSHYHDSETARVIDQATAKAIEELDDGGIAEDQACGQVPLRGLLCAARRRGLCARTLALRNSGDTAGPPDRVVGYGAFAFFEREAVPA